MQIYQKEIQVSGRGRGFHIITTHILSAIPEIKAIRNGMLHVFIKHTSASLTINENADATVRIDFESHMNNMVPENQPYYLHTMEGPDDATSHIKSSLMGSSVQMPITNGRLNMGIWQGIYLCEHRNAKQPRSLVITAFGI